VELDCFAAAVAAVPDRRARAALEPLLAWHALARVEADLAWYLAEGVVTAEQAAGLPARFNRLCEELLPGVAGLIGAFELPDVVLDSPIAGADYGEAYREPR
jgi:acyl-CoA oxidase